MEFESVIFDLFGTIIPRPDRSKHRKMIEDLADISGVDRDLFFDIWMNTNRERISRYGIDTKTLMRSLLGIFHIPEDPITIEKMTTVWYDMTISHFHFFEDVIPAFRELKMNGLKVGLLTNCGPNVPKIIESSDIDPFLDQAVYSTMEGLMKPDPEIYLRACERLGSKPSKTFFIGDGDNHELKGAHQCGLKAIKIDRGDIAGDFRIQEEEDWDPTISDLWNIVQYLQAF